MFFDKKVLGRKVEQPKIIKDHLGNIRVTVDEDGQVVTADDYYPFGMQMPGRSYNVAFSGNQYKYNSKELDDENGLNTLHYGWREYDPETGRFNRPDRFDFKYPSLSPYSYAANNPVNFIDVNGDSIWINYQDDDGNDQRLLYTQGMEYSGGNKQVAAAISSLNTLNSLKSGNTVLSSLTGSTANYNVQFGNKNSYVPNSTQQGSGGIITLANPSSVDGAAHEVFHGFQHENMNMPNSTAFEVGANLFSNSVYSELNQGAWASPYGGSQEFNNAFINLMTNKSFNQQDFNTATRTFKDSQFNSGGDYNGLDERIIIKNPVIGGFYPLIK